MRPILSLEASLTSDRKRNVGEDATFINKTKRNTQVTAQYCFQRALLTGYFPVITR